MDNFFDKFLAKSDGETTLEMHTKHVIIAGHNLIENLPFGTEEKMYWKAKLYRCAALHDLGKICSEFQRRLGGAKDVSIRHEIVSLWFCENFLELNEDEIFAIATHHKGVISSFDSKGRLEKQDLTHDIEYAIRNDKDLMVLDTLKGWFNLMQLNIKTINSFNSELRISKKWIKGLYQKYQSEIFPEKDKRKELSLMRALLIAADHIGSARLENKVPSYKRLALQDFQPKDKEGNYFSFRNFQEQLQSVQTDVILHAPTGSGKTEAALSWCFANQQENTRLFYLLPYTASINAMVSRLQNIYGKERVTALHSKTLDFFYQQLSEEESNNENNKDLDIENLEARARSKKSLSGELFYPVKVATLHQVLKTSLKGKGWELALYDYKNALFIIDEFHTYNALLTGMLLASVKLFRSLFMAKFFFMSATIPEFMLENIIQKVFDGDKSRLMRPNPSFESDRTILNRNRHVLHCQKNQNIKDRIPLLREFLDNEKSVLIIVNNVKTSQQLLNDIGFDKNSKVTLLHSGFHKKSRTEIEKKITDRNLEKRPQLLIATQAVEVSLDIDYDVAFIENAPIDALIQRFGRVNRAGNKGLAPVYLFENIIGNTKYFYDEDVLKITWQQLSKFDEKVISENDLVDVCNAVYKNGYNESQQKDFELGLNNETIRSFEKDWVAADWNNWIEEALENNSQKVEILCSNLVVEFDRFKKEKRYIEANQLFVQVYFYELSGTNFIKDDIRKVIVAYDFVYDELVGYKKKVDQFDDRCF